MTKPTTLGELRQTEWASPARIHRTVKDELRQNLICLLENGSALFPGIVGYQDTVIPQLVNALMSRHNFILLGLRGQAKSASCASSSHCSTRRFPSSRGAR